MSALFYYLRGDLTDNWPFAITNVELNGADPLLVYGLQRIDKWDKRIRFYYSEYDRAPDFQIPMVCPLHFVSERFLDALSENQLQCIDPIKVEVYPEGTGPVVTDYYIANYVYTFPALDMSRSKIVYDAEHPDKISSVLHYVLDKRKAPVHVHAFRLQESPSDIVISGQMADNLTTHSVTGTRFVPAEVG